MKSQHWQVNYKGTHVPVQSSLWTNRLYYLPKQLFCLENARLAHTAKGVAIVYTVIFGQGKKRKVIRFPGQIQLTHLTPAIADALEVRYRIGV